MEALPPPTSITRAFVVNVPPIAVHKGSSAQADSSLSGIGVDSDSHGNPSFCFAKEWTLNGGFTTGIWTTVKRHTTCMDSPLVGDVGEYKIGGGLHKKRNIDFLHGGLPDVIDILGDYISHHSKRMDQETTTPHQ